MTAPTKKRTLRGRDKKRYCPICGTRTAVPIQYGYPSEKGFEMARRGEIILGGCCLDQNNPDWGCKTCHYSWLTVIESDLWPDYPDEDFTAEGDSEDNHPPS